MAGIWEVRGYLDLHQALYLSHLNLLSHSGLGSWSGQEREERDGVLSPLMYSMLMSPHQNLSRCPPRAPVAFWTLTPQRLCHSSWELWFPAVMFSVAFTGSGKSFPETSCQQTLSWLHGRNGEKYIILSPGLGHTKKKANEGGEGLDNLHQ